MGGQHTQMACNDVCQRLILGPTAVSTGTKPGRTKLQLSTDWLLPQELINLRTLCEEGHSVGD